MYTTENGTLVLCLRQYYTDKQGKRRWVIFRNGDTLENFKKKFSKLEESNYFTIGQLKNILFEIYVDFNVNLTKEV